MKWKSGLFSASNMRTYCIRIILVQCMSQEMHAICFSLEIESKIITKYEHMKYKIKIEKKGQ